MHFFESGLTRDGGGDVLVEGPEMTREFELLMEVDLLVAEDCTGSSLNHPLVYFVASCVHNLPTTPRSAPSTELERAYHVIRQPHRVH